MSFIVTLNIHVYISDMNSSAPTRSYNNQNRTSQSEQTRRQILLATVDLWLEMPITDITIDGVAKRAGVSSRTVLRKFGSRDGLFEACMSDEALTDAFQRKEAEIGNLDQIIDSIYEHYEHEGDAVIRMLGIENEMNLAAEFVKGGRKDHAAWCERVFAPYLPEEGDPRRQEKIAAFYLATDIYQWKVLRRDFRYSVEHSKAIAKTILTGLTTNP